MSSSRLSNIPKVKSMKSITLTSSKVFHPAYCPPVEKILITDTEVKVYFSDKSVSTVSRNSTDHSIHVLEAIVQRIYGDVYLDGSVLAPGFSHDLECLYSIAEYSKNNKSISKISKVTVPAHKTSKIAKLLNSTATEFLNPRHPKNNTEYVRPNKLFKDFTPSEKREYWRASNKRRKSKNS